MTEPSRIDPSDRLADRSSVERLEEEISRYRSLLIAFSGGVDSAVLLAVAHRVLGERAIAFTADSPSMPRAELTLAREIAASIGVRHVVEATSELDLDSYRRNDPARCYWCKTTLFTRAGAFARSEGVEAVAYGYTADDAGEYRPGHRAAGEHRVAAPLFDARLHKGEIRQIAKLLALPVWDKPAAPCLSSRIPYGSEVTAGRLRVIETVEEALHSFGFAVCRARYDGTTMRVEVPRGDIAALEARWKEITAVGTECGAAVMEIDREGFRSGKLNEGIGIDTARAS